MKARTKTKAYDKIVDHIMQGSKHISDGNIIQATAHLRHAERYAKDHVGVLTQMGEHHEVKDFNHDFGNIMTIKRDQLAAKRKELGKNEVYNLAINETYDGIYLIDNLQKNQLEYKWLHELHPEDMAQVTGRGQKPKYGGTLHHEYMYPVDTGGRLVHAERKPIAPNQVNSPDRIKSLNINELSKNETLIEKTKRILAKIKNTID